MFVCGACGVRPVGQIAFISSHLIPPFAAISKHGPGMLHSAYHSCGSHTSPLPLPLPRLHLNPYCVEVAVGITRKPSAVLQLSCVATKLVVAFLAEQLRGSERAGPWFLDSCVRTSSLLVSCEMQFTYRL